MAHKQPGLLGLFLLIFCVRFSAQSDNLALNASASASTQDLQKVCGPKNQVAIHVQAKNLAAETGYQLKSTVKGVYLILATTLLLPRAFHGYWPGPRSHQHQFLQAEPYLQQN